MNAFSRRQFLKASLLTGASLAVPRPAWSRVLGANDTIQLAVVGFGGRGQDHINELQQQGQPGNVRIVALCDVDEQILGRQLQAFDKRGQKVQGYRDVRKLLENKEIDAITTATPNH